jgi:sugar lactone lactonase YvrE
VNGLLKAETLISCKRMALKLLALTIMVVLTFNGLFAPTSTMVAACSVCMYQFSWGSTGSDDGQLRSPQGVAVDSSGDVYVADQGNARIDKFTSTGRYLTQWGTFGPDKGKFYDPYGVAVAPSGRVYVTDYLKNQVEVFTNTGSFITQWGSNDTEPGTAAGFFDSPTGIAIDAAGNVYVADYHNDRVQEFDGAGNYLSWFSVGHELTGPVGVAVSPSGNVYVTYPSEDRVLEYGSSFTTWGSSGSGRGQFNWTQGVAVDSSGDVYVVDNGNSRVEKFTSNGTYITQWSTSITSNRHFSPQGIAIDSSGNVYVTISVDDRVERFGDLVIRTTSISSMSSEACVVQVCSSTASVSPSIIPTSSTQSQVGAPGSFTLIPLAVAVVLIALVLRRRRHLRRP